MIARISVAALFGLSAVALACPVAAAKPKAAAAPETELASTGPNSGQNVEELLHDNRDDGVAAIVNDTVISDYDLRQRVALFLATSGVRATADNLKAIRKQVLGQLETERLEVLEAQKKKISVSSGEVDKAIDNLIQDNHLTMDRIEKLLANAGVDMATLRGQIAAQIAWTKTVQDEYGDRVRISSADVDEAMKRMAAGSGKPHFRVSEIFEAVDTPRQDAQVLKNMQGLLEQIRAGAPFAAVARQFSQNPTAASGGDLGIVEDGQLVPELNNALVTMHAGEVSAPIKATGGYYLLLLRARIEPAGTKAPNPAQAENADPNVLPLARVLLPIGTKPSKQLLGNAMRAANLLHEHIAGCEQLPELIARMKGAMYFDLGKMQLSNLSPQIREALAKTQPGETAQPFESAAGIELIVRCDKPPPKVEVFKMPSRDGVEQQMYEEQMTVYARRYLRDLKRVADIETPGEKTAKDAAASASR